MPLAKRPDAAPAVAPAAAPQGVVTTSTTPPPSAGKKTFGKASTASDTMSKAEWAAKDQRISRQGLYQAALQSMGVLQLNQGNTLDEYLALVEKVVERGLAFVAKE